jgi:hypothetical protein
VTISQVHFRPATLADAEGVAALVNECERLGRGVTETTALRAALSATRRSSARRTPRQRRYCRAPATDARVCSSECGWRSTAP